MALVSAREHIGIASQATSRSAATAFNLVPADAGSFSATETFEQILDTGRRGSEAMDYRSFKGVGSTELTFDFPMMWGTSSSATTGCTLGTLLRNILGTGAPAISGTATLPTRAVRVASIDNHQTFLRLGTTHEYLTVTRELLNNVDGDMYERWKDCRVSSLTISANAGEGAITCSASLTGHTTAYSSSNPAIGTKSISDNIALGFENAYISTARFQPFLFGNSVYSSDQNNAANRIISFEVTLSREITPIYTMANNLNFNDVYLGPLEVTFNVVAEIAKADIDDVRANTIGKTVVGFSTAAVAGAAYNETGARSLIIGMQATSPLEAPLEIDTSASYATVSYSGRALATSDALAISGDAYTGSDDTRRTPIEIEIQEHGASGSASPTYA